MNSHQHRATIPPQEPYRHVVNKVGYPTNAPDDIILNSPPIERVIYRSQGDHLYLYFNGKFHTCIDFSEARAITEA